MARAWVGTSGYDYDHWDGVFYPRELRKKDRLAHYVQFFNALEINGTFYSLPKPETAARWRRVAEEARGSDFRFVVKGSQYITHAKKLKDARTPLRRFFRAVEPLGPRCAGVLWQLGRWRANAERVATFFDDVTDVSPVPSWWHALEARHESWFEEDVVKALRARGVALVFTDMPLQVLPPGEGRRNIPRPAVRAPQLGRVVYLRRHGPRGGFGGAYTPGMTRTDARHAKRWLDKGKDVFAFFNNDPQGYAVKDAQRLARALDTG